MPDLPKSSFPYSPFYHSHYPFTCFSPDPFCSLEQFCLDRLLCSSRSSCFMLPLQPLFNTPVFLYALTQCLLLQQLTASCSLFRAYFLFASLRLLLCMLVSAFNPALLPVRPCNVIIAPKFHATAVNVQRTRHAKRRYYFLTYSQPASQTNTSMGVGLHGHLGEVELRRSLLPQSFHPSIALVQLSQLFTVDRYSSCLSSLSQTNAKDCGKVPFTAIMEPC